MATWWGDLRYALRGLAARPVFTLVAVASLALGLGVNTAIYSLFAQVVLSPLPVVEPERLVNLGAPGTKTGSMSSNQAGNRDQIFSYAMFRDLEARRPPELAALAAHRASQVGLGARAIGGDTRNGTAMLVSGHYFETLGVVPALGRLIAPHDDAVRGEGRVAVLSHRYWRQALGGDPRVLGGTLAINGVPMTVIGVAAAGFDGTTFGTVPEVFLPISSRWLIDAGATQDAPENRKSYWVYLFARLAPGATIAQAHAALDRPYRALIRDVEVPLHGELSPAQLTEFRKKSITMVPGAHGQSSQNEVAARPLRLLLGVAAVVLLIACLNIANLLLARGAARASEFALRASLGAGRSRLARQVLVESSLLALGGVLLAMPLTLAIARGLVGWMPESLEGGFDVSLDGHALAFAAVAGLATVLLCGCVPALAVSRVAPAEALRGGGRQVSGRGGARFREGLAMLQVALSLVALVLAGLFAKTLSNLAREDLGLRPESVAVFSIAPGRAGYTPERRAALYEALEARLAALPGVVAAAGSMVPMLNEDVWGSNVRVEGHRTQPEEEAPYYNAVGPGYFEALGIPVLAGRGFNAADAAGRPKVVVVNRAFTERFGLGQQAVGKRMAVGGGDGPLDLEIVGVVADSKYEGVRAAVAPTFVLPWRQDSEAPGDMNFYVRASVPPETLLAQLPKLVAELDPDLPVEGVRTLPDQVARILVMERFVGMLSAGFAVLATVLAALGLYGLLSFDLAQRLREVGLRLALGAPPRRVAGLMLRRVLRLTVAGGALGLAGALLAGRAAQSLLFGLEAHDPRVLAGAVALLAAVAVAASLLPARRAARTDPMEALRHE